MQLFGASSRFWSIIFSFLWKLFHNRNNIPKNSKHYFQRTTENETVLFLENNPKHTFLSQLQLRFILEFSWKNFLYRFDWWIHEQIRIITNIFSPKNTHENMFHIWASLPNFGFTYEAVFTIFQYTFLSNLRIQKNQKNKKTSHHRENTVNTWIWGVNSLKMRSEHRSGTTKSFFLWRCRGIQKYYWSLENLIIGRSNKFLKRVHQRSSDSMIIYTKEYSTEWHPRKSFRSNRVLNMLYLSSMSKASIATASILKFYPTTLSI